MAYKGYIKSKRGKTLKLHDDCIFCPSLKDCSNLKMAIKIIDSELGAIKPDNPNYESAQGKVKDLKNKLDRLGIGTGADSCRGAECRCKTRELVNEATALIRLLYQMQNINPDSNSRG